MDNMDNAVTYRQLHRLLIDLRFVDEPADERWKAFRHGDTGTLILLARHRPSLRAREADVVSVRRQLVDNGLIEEIDFEDFLSQGRLVQSS
jgi:hypothetical protein